MTHPAKTMYDFLPSLKEEVITVDLSDTDDNRIKVDVNLEFAFDEHGNKVVIAYYYLTEFDRKRFNEWDFETLDAITKEHKLSTEI